MYDRKTISAKNTGKFYVELFREMFGGEILGENKMPLFPNARKKVSSDPNFYPDIAINGDMKTTYIEVKAVSSKSGRPWFSHHQISRYCRALLENPGSEMLTGIFRYGACKPQKLYICDNQDGHACDNRCLVEKLASSTRDLLILPHNLLTFLLILPSSEEMNQTSSDSCRNFENYKKPRGAWLSLLRKYSDAPQEAINKILESLPSAPYNFREFAIDDFFLQDLTAEQSSSSDKYTIHCKSGMLSPSYRMNPFTIVRYNTPHSTGWIKYLRENLDKFLGGLGIKEIYEGKTEDLEERKAMREEDLPLLSELKTSTKNEDVPI